MQAAEFYRVVTMDRTDALGRLIALLNRHSSRYCVIGGQAVNAYVEPLVSLDLDIVIAADDLDALRRLFADEFQIEEFPYSLNLTAPGSDLRVQIQTDPRYAPFVDRAVRRDVLGTSMLVAAVGDLLQGKVWAATDERRRPSKRRKDMLDIERLLDAFPDLRSCVPPELLDRLI